jgi:hypothetical protein
MLNDGPVMLFLLLGLAIAWWASANRAREHACFLAKRFCASHSWQLLDQTVSLQSLWPQRGERGLQWVRVYGFEFSSDGGNRHRGWLRVVGRRAQSIRTDIDQSPT